MKQMKLTLFPSLLFGVVATTAWVAAQDTDLDGIPNASDPNPTINAVVADPDGNNNLPASLNTGLIGRWDCETLVPIGSYHGFADLAGNDQPVECRSFSMSVDNSGMISKAALFDQEADHLSAAPSLVSGRTAFSVSMWFKLQNNYVQTKPTSIHTVFFAYNNALDAYPEFFLTIYKGIAGSPNQKIVFNRYVGTSVVQDWSAEIPGGIYVDNAKWHHLSMVKNGANYRLFLNGVKIKDTAGTSGSWTATGTGYFCFGKGIPNGISAGHSFRGSMDRLRFYSRNLSDTEVSALYGQDSEYDGYSDISELQWVGSPSRSPFYWEMTDTDADGMDDNWEILRFGNLSQSGTADFDNDGLSNVDEYLLHTNPVLADTDSDGMPDGYEYDQGYNPLVSDTAGDPDGDGLDRLGEYLAGSDPNNPDTDGDTLPDGDEVNLHGTDPTLEDTDGDWMPDPYEVDNGLDATDPLDAWTDADGDGLPNFGEFAFEDQGYDPQVADAAGFDWNGDPDQDGLTNQQELLVYYTNPRQPDSDLDGMDDGWELQWGFDPRVSNETDGNPSNNPSADPDGDGLTNEQESSLGTNPNNADTDGDGVGDGVENGQGSNPNDPGSSTPPANGTIQVNIHFGDHSGSHSEKYKLKLEPLDGDTYARELLNRRYGETQTETVTLSKGARYKITLDHSATDPKYKDDPKPDYDYTLEISQVGTANDSLFILKDPQGILGVHDESTPFFASGKNADLFVVQFKTETVSDIPTNKDRKKLGVKEEVFVEVVPSSIGVVNWTLNNQLDAVVAPTVGRDVFFTADTRARTTTLRATLDTGATHDIVWSVVEPSGETAAKVRDLPVQAGIQGVGMELRYTTSPIDVSFYNVEVREIDKGTSNVTGFFSSFPAASLVHTPTADWVGLTEGNTWLDQAGFSGWGFPSTWSAGTYQWDIEVRWRTEGETGQGVVLGNRTQLHTLHDSTGKSTESKSGQTATRTP